MKIQSGQDDAVTVRARKQWRFSGHPYLSGEIENVRLDASSLGLTPLYLTSLGDWDPAREYWGEEGEPSFAWARPILARGPRPQFEMEQILPGSDPADPFEDPILKAVEFHQVGDFERAHEILTDLARADRRPRNQEASAVFLLWQCWRRHPVHRGDVTIGGQVVDQLHNSTLSD